MARRVISPLAGPRFGGDEDSDVVASTGWPNGSGGGIRPHGLNERLSWGSRVTLVARRAVVLQ